MDKYHLHWFTDEISIHTSSASASFLQLQNLLGRQETFQSREVWFVLVAFLTHAAMISKFFDPINPDKIKVARGATLRKYLQVDDNSPIFQRFARDNLEHFDERIDRWVSTKKTIVLEMVFHDREGYDYIANRDCAIRRVLIANEMVFVSEDRKGKVVELQLTPIYTAIQSLKEVCTVKLQTESPYNYMLAEAVRNHKPTKQH